jgi:hypothetical protein
VECPVASATRTTTEIRMGRIVDCRMTELAIVDDCRFLNS